MPKFCELSIREERAPTTTSKHHFVPIQVDSELNRLLYSLEFPPLVGKNAESNRKKKQRKKQARLELEADESEGVEQEGDKEEEELAKGMLATELEQRE